ncbi:MAG: SBBP repeat-containing protein [Pseudomonadota bacterium]
MSLKPAQNGACQTLFSPRDHRVRRFTRWGLMVSAIAATTASAFAPAPSDPLAYLELNQGQTEARYAYIARTRQYSARLTAGSAEFLYLTPFPKHNEGDGKAAPKRGIVTMRFAGASTEAPLRSAQALPGKSHYLKGDATEWITDVPHFGEVRFANVYPQIDVIYRIDGNTLRYDFVVGAGGDPSRVRLSFDHVDDVRISEDGQLELRAEHATMTHSAPTVFQRIDGELHPVAGSFIQTSGGALAFRTARHDADHELVIDPQITLSTFLGGSATDAGNDLVIGPDGSIFVTGDTSSVDFPTEDGLPPGEASGGLDIYVARLTPDGQALEFATFIGGENDEEPWQIALDSNANPIITGYTASPDFPTAAAAQTTFAGGGLFDSDVFVSKLTSNGDGFVFSTFLGGLDLIELQFGYEWARGLVVDADDHIYVTGETSAPDFPATHEIDGRACLEADQLASFVGDAFIAKYSPQGALEFATCFGGEERDNGRDVALAEDGSLHVVGFTRSNEFPVTADAYQGELAGNYDVHVTHLSPDATEILSSTYLGGTNYEFAQQIRLLADGSRLVSGTTGSDDFPTTFGAFQRDFGGNEDGYLARVSADGSYLLASTLIGGNDAEDAWAVQVGEDGLIYVAGTTESLDFPLASPLQAERTGGGAYGNVVIDEALDTNDLGTSTYVDELTLDFYTVVAAANNGVNRLYLLDDDAGDTVVRSWDFGSESANTQAIAAVFVRDELGQVAIAFADEDTPAQVVFLGDDPLQTLPLPIALASEARDTRAIAGDNIGDPDLAIGNYLAPNFLHRAGADGFAEEEAAFPGSENTATTALAFADVNGDGFEDLVEGNDLQPNAVYFSDAGNGSFLPATFVDNEADPTRAIRVVDVDADGDVDLFVGNNGAPNRLYLNDGTGSFGAPITLDPEPTTTFDVRSSPSFGGEPFTLLAVGEQDAWHYKYLNGAAERLPLTDGSLPARALDSVSSVAVQAGPIGSPIQQVFASVSEGFLAVLDPSARELLFSTLLGGENNEIISWGLVIDADRNAYVTGGTRSADFPTVNPLQNQQAGDLDGFITKISLTDVELPARNRYTTVLDLQTPGIDGISKIVLDWTTLSCDEAQAEDLYDLRLSLIAGASLVYSDPVLGDGVLNPLVRVPRGHPAWTYSLDTLTLSDFSTGVEETILAADGIHYRVGVIAGLEPGATVLIERYEDGVLIASAESLLRPQYTLALEGDCDGDGVNAFNDNCLFARNPDQRDSNGDGIGNRCDADLDNDCEVSVADLRLLRDALQTADEDADLNGDGIVNNRDLRIARGSLFGPPGPSGVPNACSARP